MYQNNSLQLFVATGPPSFLTFCTVLAVLSGLLYGALYFFGRNTPKYRGQNLLKWIHSNKWFDVLVFNTDINGYEISIWIIFSIVWILMVDNEKNKLTHEYLKYTFKSAFCKITSPHVPPPPPKKMHAKYYGRMNFISDR